MSESSLRQGEPQVDVIDLALIAWRSWRLVIACMLVIGAGFAIYAFSASIWYRAEVVLVQVEEDVSSNLLGQFGDLASLAGISTEGSSKRQARVAILSSRDVAREFIEREALEPQLLEAVRGGVLSRAIGSLTGQVLDSRDALRFFDLRVRAVEEDKKAGVVRVAMVWKDPELAARWANAFALYADNRLRGAAQRDAVRNVEYLKSELAKTNVPAMQQSLSRLLETEMGKVLLTRGGTEYAFKVVDTATVPKEKFRPKRMLLVAVGCVFGLILGVASSIVRHVAARRAPQANAANPGVSAQPELDSAR
jgi:uncharacterized protein involved in exopolysaccharide biosynthesis